MTLLYMAIPLITYLVSPLQNASLKKTDPWCFFFRNPLAKGERRDRIPNPSISHMHSNKSNAQQPDPSPKHVPRIQIHNYIRARSTSASPLTTTVSHVFEIASSRQNTNMTTPRSAPARGAAPGSRASAEHARIGSMGPCRPRTTSSSPSRSRSGSF